MPPKSSAAFAHQPVAKMILREHLAQLESSLEETRGRVLSALDEELASIRQWMESLKDFDTALTVYRPEAETSAEGSEKTPSKFKPSKPSNIVELTAQDFAMTPEPLREPALDPTLEQATMDELNAALAAVFEHMGHKPA
ncbi:hypothetical protein DES53_105109 [Roseimicrobium gellanilyticum]|uniref:Uncharacterized protein n=1 Tax=Roseimicrobium gellanilyticum TaxID=748857 RepID=A0A366HL98_9BACT|nr:hypothetical protein [Roseimicrobium gellanilyticum]RBP43710.1 hypothetical protein DES53_105109 [Roseimicrobium gellanilyticum]